MGQTPHVTTQVVTALSRAIRRNSAQIVADLPAAARGDRAAIHGVRIASRRLRAALPIAGETAGVDVRPLLRDVRRVTRALAGVREADVVHSLIRALPAGDAWRPVAIERLDERCARLRARERRSARAALARVDASDLQSRLGALAGRLEDARDGSAMAAAFVAEARRRARTLAEAVGEAGTVYAVEPLHRIRLAAKKLRYVLEVGSRAMPGVAGAGGRATRRLRRLQGQLGRLHDIQMTQQHVRTAAAEAEAVPVLVAELADLDRALEVQCRQVHASILRTRAGLDALLQDVERAAAGLLVPREIGRMARMRVVAHRRVAAR